ncbi:MAG: Pr6Pr family membrane protein [Glaciihabitans sp.]
MRRFPGWIRAGTEVMWRVSIRSASGLVRLAAAGLCVIALIARFVWGLGTATFTPSNFFAYLTIQSNIAFVVVAIFSGLRALHTSQDPPWLATMRAVVLSWTLTAGLVFAVLIQQAGARGVRIDVPWSDLLLHFWLPAVALVDWLVAPGRGRGLWRALPIVLVYPVLWGAVTLVRGAFVGWYPYFFLDPAQVSGVGEFLFFCALALGAFLAVGSLVISLSRSQPLAVRWMSRGDGALRLPWRRRARG